MVESLQSYFEITFYYLKGYLFALGQADTLWFGALVAALGAFGGAAGAQFISYRSSKRRALEDTLAKLNKAAFLSQSVCGSFISMKDQQINELFGNYQLARRSFEYAKKNPPSEGVYTVNFQLESLPQITTESREILKTVLELDILLPKPILLATLLQSTINDFSSYNAQRNEWIEKFRALDASDEYKTHLYFGRRVSEREQDKTYPSLVEALKEKCDAIIAFSHLLTEQFVDQAWELRRKHYWRFDKPGVGAPIIILEKPEFLPDMEKYQEFVEKRRIPKKKKWESWRAHRERLFKDTNWQR